MIQLTYLSAVGITGPDAGDFLQSQLSADILALDVGQSTFAAYCSPRGQVLGLLLIGRSADGYFLIGASDLLAGIVKRLRIFVMRSKVEFDESVEYQVLGIPAGEAPPDSYQTYSPDEVDLTYAVGVADGSLTDSPVTWKSKELVEGVAWLDPDTAEKYIPQMLGQDNIGALSFNKGCYPGQEIVARTRYLGKVKRKPLILTVNEPARITNGTKLKLIYADQTLSGVLIDSAVKINDETVLFIVTNLIDDQVPGKITLEDQEFTVVQ
jgi:folate-binding protein YgfZ